MLSAIPVLARFSALKYIDTDLRVECGDGDFRHLYSFSFTSVANACMFSLKDVNLHHRASLTVTSIVL